MPVNPITRIPEDIADLPICVVDLGFAERRMSVGIACNTAGEGPNTHQFGGAVSWVTNWLQARSVEHQDRAVLVIEAPLSMAFTGDGNPCHRNVELQRNYVAGCAPRSPKGWWYQAGANLSLGSSVFLRSLTLPQELTVLLAEAFYCSMAPGEEHPNDDAVAAELLAALQGNPGTDLASPESVIQGGTVELLPGLEELMQAIPGILLRPGLLLQAD